MFCLKLLLVFGFHDLALGEDPCSGCSLQTYWGSEDSLSVFTRGIFAVWWDPKFDHEADAQPLYEILNLVRDDCLTNLGMADPPNPDQGFFYNVYIHHGQDDLFPSGWALGQGTDPFGLPFLTVPHGSLGSRSIYHEGFHIFQYMANSPGFAYAADSQWYVETSAQWYMANYFPEERDTFMEAGAIIGNPQLALWHSFGNEAPEDPNASDGRAGWMYGVRQYGMHTLLTYLTEVAGVDRGAITDGFYAGTNQSPQEYLYRRVGPALMRSHFADWAAHTSAELDYLTREQVERAYLEVGLAGDWDLFRPSVWTAQDTGTEDWISPPEELVARGWAFNVFNITNNLDEQTIAIYTFELQGEEQGSQGGKAAFEGRIIVMEEGGAVRVTPLDMFDDLAGLGTETIGSGDKRIMLAVVAVPEVWGSYQHYNYRIRVDRSEMKQNI